MKLHSLIDPKNRKKVLEAIEKGDGTLLKRNRKERPSARPLVEQPTAQKQISPEEQEKLNQELLEAARKGDTFTVQQILKKGADANGRDNDGRTALMYSTEHSNTTKFIKLLIQNGAHVDARDNDGNTSFMLLSMDGQLTLAQFLWQEGADLNAKNNSDETALMLASSYGQSSMIELLIRLGADVNARDNDGRTALARGCLKEVGPLIVEKIAQILKKHGATE